MTRRRAAAMVVFGAALALTTAVACRVVPRSGPIIFSQVATTEFQGDSSSDSALYLYARSQRYQLLTDSGSFRTDSSGVLGSIEVCIEGGSTATDYTALADGRWRALGCVIRSGPVSADYPYLESGMSLILLRRSAAVWQAGILGLTTRQVRTMLVSGANTRATLGAEARRFTVGPRIYVCYTCDRKACCPGNAQSVSNMTQAQADVDNIATNW